MDYIQELRSKIGHQPLVLVGATVLILNENNHLLMQKRNDNGQWGIPGGYTEPNEYIEDTIRRETFEETGIKLGNIRLVNVYSGPELFYEYPNGDQVHNVSIVYITNDYSHDRKTNDGDGSEIRFFPIENIPVDISPPIRLIIKDLQNGRITF
jgi:8-oxo-dGTP pyrophosphatase MutT (NUDIX family)